MPFPKPFALVAWGGFFAAADNQDDWSCTLKFTAPNGDPSFGGAISDAGAKRVFEIIGDHWFQPDLGIRRDAHMKWAKVNAVGTNGRYLSSTDTNFYEWENEKTGGVDTTHPYQIAACATLLTPASRGLASKGRIFLPTGLPFDPAATGINLLKAQSMANAVMLMLDDLNRYFRNEGNAVACVMSQERTGAVNPVTQIAVGNRFDIQRRRDNAERETYSYSAQLTAPAPVGSDPGGVEGAGTPIG